MNNRFKLILIEPDSRISDTPIHYVLVDTHIKIDQISYGESVAEKLTNGKYDVFQIDNINDIDLNNQYAIIATSIGVSHYLGFENTKEELDNFLIGKNICDVEIETYEEEYQDQYSDGTWARSISVRDVPKAPYGRIKILNRITTNEEMKDALVRVLELFHPTIDDPKEIEQEEILKFIKKIVKK